jgi:membrane fusion protein (multidrug efflux system)
MWVNFSISENEQLRFRDEVAKGLVKPPPGNQFDVEVVLADGSVYPERGRISFADPSYSKETGTFLVRATFTNPKATLRPGQFVRVNVLGATRPGAILLPQRAVQQGAKSHFVWVAAPDEKAEQRAVVVGIWIGDDWVISQGLRAGEQVVVDGGIRVTPGAQLKVSAYGPGPKGSAAPARGAAEPTPLEKDIISGKKNEPGAR